MKQLLLLFSLFLVLSAFAQKPDSVLYDGQWHYIYPIVERLEPTDGYLDKAGMIEEEFSLYRSWRKSGDARAQLKKKKLEEALKQELLLSKRMTEADYLKRKKSRGGFQSVKGLDNTLENNNLDQDLEPYVGNLPNGRYVQYFDEFYTYGKPSKMERLPQKVACVFGLQENQLHGNYLRCTYDGDTLRSGVFIEGQRDGRWYIFRQTKEVYYKFNRWMGFSEEYIVADFSHGDLHGHFEYWQGNTRLSGGQFDHNRMVGEWLCYSEDWNVSLRFDVPSGSDSCRLDVLNLWKDETFQLPVLETEDEMYSDELWHLYGGYIQTQQKLNFSYDLRKGLLPLFQGFIIRGRSEKSPEKEKCFTAFETHLEGWDAYYPDHPIFSYRYDSGLNAVLGAHYFHFGLLADTIGFDAEKEVFFRKVWNGDGYLCFEKTWNRSGTPLSEKKYNVPVTGDRVIEGFHVFADMKEEGYVWNNPYDSIIGSRRYKMISWQKNGKRYYEEYIDTATGKTGKIEYNAFGDVAMRTVEEYEEGTDYRRPIPDVYREEVIWGDLAFYSHYGEKETPDFTEGLFVDGKPYSGKLQFINEANRTEYKMNRRNGLVIKHAEDESRFFTHRRNRSGGLPQFAMQEEYLTVLGTIRTYFGDVEISGIDEMHGEFLNGKPFGKWQFSNKKGRLLFELTYDANGNPSGTCLEYEKRWYMSAFELETDVPLPKHRVNNPPLKEAYLLNKYTLVNGERHGPFFSFNNRGDTIQIGAFDNGKLNGPQWSYRNNRETIFTFDHRKRIGDWRAIDYRFDSLSGKILSDTVISMHFDNDTLNGPVLLLDQKGTYHSAFFRNGKPEGELIVHDSKKHADVERVELHNGILMRKDTYVNGVLSYRYEYPESDSMRYADQELMAAVSSIGKMFDSFWVHNGKHYSTRESTVFVEKGHAYFTKFDPSGQPSRRGPAINNKRTGRWEYFSYGGKPIYTIEYHKRDSTHWGYGLLTELDSLGNILNKRLVLSEEEKYNCSQDEYYAIREYQTVEDAPGGPDFMNGPVRYYFDNGMLMSEGNVENGLSVGIWKFYTPDGKLTRVGRYEKGKKEGRWLSGDLSDKSYIGEVCIDPDNPNHDVIIANMERELDVIVSYYRSGEELTKQLYTIQK